jgi:hypothetical protein
MDNDEIFTLIENRLYHLRPPYPALPSTHPPLTSSGTSPTPVPPLSSPSSSIHLPSASSSTSSSDLPYPSSILLSIQPIGSWIIKFKKDSILINDTDLIFPNLLSLDATMTFHSFDSFWLLINSTNKPSDEDLKSNSEITSQGNLPTLLLLLTLLNESSARSLSGSYGHGILGSSSTGGRRNSFSHPSNKKTNTPNTISTGGTHSNSGMSSHISPTASGGPAGSSGGHGNGSGMKSTKDKVSEGTKSMKAGWLYKKRDIIAGWRLRYFKLYVGRIEYFTDHTALVPRGVIPLYAAEVTGPKICSVNGNEEHWSIM